MNDVSLVPLDRLPLIPEQILRAHHVAEPYDDRFRSCARLLQALWREDKGLPLGTYISSEGKRKKLGSRITAAAGLAGANFLSPSIAHLTHKEVAYREIGALIDEDRLWTNLLSSMPLTFNLLGPLSLDLALATRTIQNLIPDLHDAKVRAVWFEHSPGRGSATFTNDGTAFDALIIYERASGQTGFIAIEIKYAETMQEPVPRMRPRYDDLASSSGLFIDPESQALRTNPLQQLWREHLLAHSMLANKLYDEGRLIVIGPDLNYQVQNAIGGYRCQLNQLTDRHAGFDGFTLEQVIEAMASAGEAEHARALYRRYCDWHLIDGEIELSLTKLTEARTKPESAPRAAA
ncbi:hypothetical protein AB4097_19350 [Microvirga sp. 2MCAF35]|uniref:PGN_0703 family putative restriction endonuclease n=1 Tax=Microvirga sp. 2MCAF35 TaxID=3232987 RepID=UPI003F96148F